MATATSQRTQYVTIYNTVVPAMLAVDPTIKFSAIEFSDYGLGTGDQGDPMTYSSHSLRLRPPNCRRRECAGRYRLNAFLQLLQSVRHRH